VFLDEFAVVSAGNSIGPELPPQCQFLPVAGRRSQAKGLQRSPVIG